jgi:hypothetical protein
VSRCPRFVAIAALLTATACASPPATPPASPAPPTPAHPILVTLVVDQLAAWIASDRFDLLPSDGGFARLRREGTTVRAMRYEHAVTDTAPGHSALYTGVVPAVSGIFANEVLAEGGRSASVLEDPATRLVAEGGVIDRPGSSLARLKVETLADELRAEHPDATIIALSIKDRGALFAAGRHPTAAVWLDVKSNRFVTSTAFAKTLPPWAAATLALRHAEASTWDLLDRSWVTSHSATPDDEAGEGDIPGYGTVFPHHLGAAQRPELAFRTSPFADDVLLAMGLAALDAEHAGEHETLLALSLSANDYISHTFGPDSWEAWDELLRLDRSLATFFTGLDSRFGTNGYAVLLTADHGSNAMPEVGRHAFCDAPAPDAWKRACAPAHRVMPDDLARTLVAAARDALGPGDWVAGVSDPYVYLTPAARTLDAARRATLNDALKKTTLATPGVAAFYDTHALPVPCPPFADESVDALVCRSVLPGAADFYVVLRPGSFFDPSIVVGKGTSHGSPYLYDRTVPLLARAPGRIAAGARVEEATFDTFAATAASMLGITQLVLLHPRVIPVGHSR